MSAVLANTELYEVPLPDSQQIAFTPTKDGLPVFHGKSYEDHKEAWIHVTETIQHRLWALGSIAASLVKRYGDGAVKQLSKDVKVSTRRIYELAKTYRVFQKCERSQILPFHHHTVAADSNDPEEAITKAEVGDWSTRQLEHYVETGLEPGETSGITAEVIAKAALSDETVTVTEESESHAMIAHLLKAQKTVIDLRAECPRPQFASDVYDDWLDDLKDHLEQTALENLKDKVVAAWLAGKYVEEEIAALAAIPKDEIHAVMKAYEREGVFEKIQRRKTDKAKGTRPWIWHLVGESIGSDYERIPVTNSYHDPNMGGNSDW